jgi:glycosyltransferase involved in cell wall biosynthesis
MRESAIRVCVVSPLYHPSLGGLGRQAKLLSERLSREGVSLFVIARRMKNMPAADFRDAVNVYRAWALFPKIHNYEGVSIRNVLISLTFSISCCWLLFMERKKYDIVHFHGASLPLFFNILPLKLLKKKIIAKVAAAKVSVEAGSLRGKYIGIGNLIDRLLQKVDGFIAISSEIADGLRLDGIKEDRIHRVTNFIDTTCYSAAAAEEKAGLKTALGLGNAPLVTFSGRYDQRKGINYLLEAWKIASSKAPEARLLLLGDGPLFDEMKDLAASLGINGSIVMKGHVRNVIDYLRASDLYVFPSLQEGMPNALLEAMACGLPAVGTRIGGVVDIIEDGKNGVLVEPRDSDGLAEGVVHLLKDREKTAALAEAAFQRIASVYSLDSIVLRYIELYQSLMR